MIEGYTDEESDYLELMTEEYMEKRRRKKITV